MNAPTPEYKHPTVDELEQALFAELSERRKKVAVIVMNATAYFTDYWNTECSEAKMDKALARLVARNDVLSFGDVENWRDSEIFRKDGREQ